MKQIILFLFTTALISCGSSKTIRVSKKDIKGDWILTSIAYNQGGSYSSTVFNDASNNCFEGSIWEFFPDNNSGVYTLDGVNCETEQRHFVFTIQEVNTVTGLYDFLLKPTDENHESETNQSFKLKISGFSKKDMQWQQSVNVAGSSFVMDINFIKK